jgi:hypothetical protein
MENHGHIELTSSEISTLWTAYQSDTMAVCGLKHFLVHVEDESIKELLEEILSTINVHIKRLTDFFHKENYPVPQGFTNQDVNLSAPRIFSDKLYLEYAYNMTIMSMATYSVALAVAVRKDVADYFGENLVIAKDLHRKAKKLSLEKGTFIRPPVLPKPNQIDFVKKESFLAGWFADRRPLLGVEITNLVFNAKRNAVGHAVITGFSQLAKSKEIRKFFERGSAIARKHVEIFSSILHEENLHEGTLLMAPEVTDSTESPFSDKLMLFLVTSLIASGIGQYGISMSASPRRDLGAHYSRLIAEITTYADDGANIMIGNGWMEQPPMAADRKGLAE